MNQSNMEAMNEAGEYIEKTKIYYNNEDVESVTSEEAKTAVNKALEQVGKEVNKNEFSTFLIRKDSLEKIITNLKL